MNRNSLSSVGRVQQFVRSHLVETITVTIASSFLLTGVSTWNVWKIYQGFQSTITQQFDLEKRSGEIRHLDEVLTMSARMAAQTGDKKWEKRYNDYVPKLDTAIKEALAGANDAIRQEASQTDAANQALIKMETAAFEEVGKKNLAAAQAILFGSEYEAQKIRYSTGNDKVLASIETLIQRQIDTYRRDLLMSIGFAVAILPILIGSWLIVLAAVRSYIEERQEAQMALQDSQSNLLATNSALQTEAQQRQQEQANVQQESLLLQQDISDLLDAVAEMEGGNLTTTAPVSDRITGLVGDTLNRLTEELARVMMQFAQAAEQVASNSSGQKSIAAKVASSTSEQSASVGSVLSLTKGIRTSVKNAAQQLATTNQSLLTLQGTVTNSQQSIEKLDAGIDILQNGSDRIVQQIKTLGEFVGLADRFVQDQSEISIQTQILALNASLVASRAAEQRDPQKFAAVAREFESIADQVSQLAQQTNEGLTELEQRSSQISLVVTAVDGEVQQLGTLVKDFTKGVKEASNAFEAVQQVTQQAVEAGEVVAQTNQQIINATDLTAMTVDSIAQLSKQIATEAQDAQQIGDRMGELSENLLDSIRVFTLPASSVKTLESAPVPATV
jgi:methyl-accepting chemotaxis protein PixJ